jgi:hypothetical protein
MPPSAASRGPSAADWHLCAWCGLVLAGHSLFLSAPYVNLEWAFSEAAQALADPAHREGLDRYWAVQANPLGYALLTATLLKGLGLPATSWVIRLPSLLGGVLLLVAGRLLFRPAAGDRPDLFGLWCAAVTLNPLVWCYTGHASADVLPAGLACVALALAFRAEGRLFHHLAAGIVFALAAVVKFNALLLGVGFVAAVGTEVLPAGRWPSRLAALACCLGPAAAALAAYFAWVDTAFGVVLIPERFKEVHEPWKFADQSPLVFALYASYLALLLGPLAAVPVLRLAASLRARWTALLAAGAVGGAALFFALVGEPRVGEMDYGAFDHLLPGPVRVAFRAGSVALGVFFVLDLVRAGLPGRDRFGLVVAAAVLPYLLVSSLSRPAQRYLVLVLPLLLFHLIVLAPPGLRRPVRWLGWASVGAFAVASFLGSCYLAAEGHAAEDMAVWVEQHGLTGQTDPGAIQAHAGDRFPATPAAAPAWVVRTEPEGECLHRVPMRVFGYEVRSYYLCRREAAD